MTDAAETYRGRVMSWNTDFTVPANLLTTMFEHASATFLCRLGLAEELLRLHGTGLVVHDQHIRYQTAVRAKTLVAIKSAPVEIRDRAMRCRHAMVSGKNGALLAVMDLLLGYVHRASGVPQQLPSQVVENARQWMQIYGRLEVRVPVASAVSVPPNMSVSF